MKRAISRFHRYMRTDRSKRRFPYPLFILCMYLHFICSYMIYIYIYIIYLCMYMYLHIYPKQAVQRNKKLFQGKSHIITLSLQYLFHCHFTFLSFLSCFLVLYTIILKFHGYLRQSTSSFLKKCKIHGFHPFFQNSRRTKFHIGFLGSQSNNLYTCFTQNHFFNNAKCQSYVKIQSASQSTTSI